MRRKIWLALLGLLILVPILFGYRVLNGQYERVMAELDALRKQVQSLEDELASPRREVDLRDRPAEQLAKLAQIQSTMVLLQERVLGLERELNNVLNTVVTQTYRFETPKSGELVWTIDIPLGKYLYYKARPRPSIFEYSVMATDPYDDEFIDRIVHHVDEVVAKQNLSKTDLFNLVLAFMQRGITYAEDMLTTGREEYPRYSVETLFERAGDCEDTSVLAAAILSRMGYDVALILFEEFDHMGLGINYPLEYGNSWVYEGKRYWYLDTTGRQPAGWAPREYEKTAAYILPVGQ